jgi:hypothetical protein
MRLVPRMLTNVLLDANRHFPAVVVTVPRPAGKITSLHSGKRVRFVGPWARRFST